MINIDYSSIQINDSKMITGKINIDYGKGKFPEKDWNDFIILILNQWIGEILESKNDMTFHFYDGKYSYKLIKEINSLCYSLKVNDKRDIKPSINYSEFIINLKYHSNKILRDYAMLIDNPDYQILQDLHGKLVNRESHL